MLVLEHTIFMLKNFYVTDTFVYGSGVCLVIAAVAVLVRHGMIVKWMNEDKKDLPDNLTENDDIQSKGEKLIKRCEFWVIISLIGYCILAILNFMILPYSVPIYDWDGLTLHRIMVVAVIDAILVAFVYIRDVKKQLAMFIGENKKL